jgi:hypothetical protein
MAKRKQFCFNCGEPQGEFDAYGEIVSCGKVECEREARNAQAAEREDAHRNLDESMGWDRP